MHPDSVQICQKLHDWDFECRVAFYLLFLQKDEEYSIFARTLIMSDGPHLGLYECVNRQNFRFWCSKNPIDTREVPLLSKRAKV